MTGPADVPVYCCDECGTLYPGDIQLRLRKPNHQILAENDRLRAEAERLRAEVEQLRATHGLPADLVRVLRDQSVIVSQDASVFKVIAKWQNAPSGTASADLPDDGDAR